MVGRGDPVSHHWHPSRPWEKSECLRLIRDRASLAGDVCAESADSDCSAQPPPLKNKTY